MTKEGFFPQNSLHVLVQLGEFIPSIWRITVVTTGLDTGFVNTPSISMTQLIQCARLGCKFPYGEVPSERQIHREV